MFPKGARDVVITLHNFRCKKDATSTQYSTSTETLRYECCTSQLLIIPFCYEQNTHIVNLSRGWQPKRFIEFNCRKLFGLYAIEIS